MKNVIATWPCFQKTARARRFSAHRLLPSLLPGALLIAMSSVIHAQSSATRDDSLLIVENTPQRLHIQFRLPPPYFSQEEIDGERYDVPRLAGFELQHQSGRPALPVASFLLILPPTGEPVVRVTAVPGQRFEAKQLLPSVIPHISQETGSISYELSTLPTTSTFAGEPARVMETGWWRGFRLGRLEIFPLDVSPNGGVQFYSSLEVIVDFPESTISPRTELSPEEKQILHSALNFQPAKIVWRQSPARQLKTQAAPAWPLPLDSEAFKIAVNADGMYALTYEELADAGAPIQNWQPGFIHLWHRGIEVPMHFIGNADSLFESGERLIFFGERRRGEAAAYFNDYSDENIYWLTANAEPALRMAERRVTDDAGIGASNYFFEKRHFEEDELYYHGDNDAQIFSTLPIPGEGWIWRKLLAGEQFSTSLLLQNAVTNAPPCSLAVRVRGITIDPVKPNHRVQFLLNDNMIGEAVFTDNQEVVFRGEFPAAFTRAGSNNFTVKSVGVGSATIDQIYLDWVEIGYWRSYVASDNFLPFRRGASANSPRSRFVISNLHNDIAQLYDRAQQTILTGFEIKQYSPMQWQVSFIDSASANSEYWISTADAFETPAAIDLNAPSNWRDPSNAADYIIITYHDFREAAERLAGYRRHSSGRDRERFRVAVVDIEEVYDEFNFGMPDPEAIRAFFQHAYENWTLPSPRYALLLGDASWDPKLNASSSRKQNFILPFGNPVSDNRFVCLDGPQDFIPELFIGRLPVETAEQALAVVEKIITYENQPPQAWHKNFTFLSGGVDAFEQQLFQGQSENLINRYVAPPPVGGRAQRLYKNTPGRLIGELRPQILSAIDNGALMFTFLGHAGSQTWELMLINEDLVDLRNDGRLPFIASMSCHTARYANPDQDSFGETFLRLPQAGAAAFWGTSGWGFVFQDEVLLNKLLASFSQDSVRAAGVLTTLAKVGLWQQYGNSSNNINTIDQYSLLGDPALNLALPRTPELVMRPSHISFTPAHPTDRTPSVKVKVVVRNDGLAANDSVVVRLAIGRRGEVRDTLFTAILSPVALSDSVFFDWPTDNFRGEYLIHASVDPAEAIEEVDETNNDAEASIYFFTSSSILAAPPPFAKVNSSQPILSVHNPAFTAPTPRAYFFEIDTTANFSSGFQIASPAIPEGVLQTAWQAPQPLVDGLYFWRSRVSEGAATSPWQSASLRIARGGQNGFAQYGGEQLGNALFLRTRLDSLSSTAKLAPDASRALPFEVQSSGYEDGSRCYLIVNLALVNGGVNVTGHHLVAIDPVSHAIRSGPAYFNTYADARAADSLAAFIEALPPRTIVLAGIRDEGSFRMNERAHRAFESLGSAKTRQVGFRDGWAMIGQKGLPIGEALEEHRVRGTGTAAVNFTHVPFHQSGTVQSTAIGPASAWKNLRWQGRNQANGATVEVEVYGREHSSSSWSLLQRNAAEEQDIASISAQRFPFLQLVARLSDDDGLDSPELLGWEIDFDESAELAVSASTVHVNRDSVFAGEAVDIRAEVYNFGEIVSDAVVAFYFNHPDSGRVRFATSKTNIGSKSSAAVAAVWQPAGGAAPGRLDLTVEVDPENQIAEAYELNNLATVPVYVMVDTTAPELRLTIDGKIVMLGDYVAAQPLMICEVFDDLAINDTSQVRLLLNGMRISHAAMGEALRIESQENGRLQARIHYRPALEGGRHVIEFFVRDTNRNTGYARAEVVVETDFRLESVMNYPNPFDRATDFTYYLTQTVERVSIKIFTLSGRLIRAFDEAPTTAGFNRLHWDGRDADGDELANGVYIYKISARREGRNEEVIEKCVVMR